MAWTLRQTCVLIPTFEVRCLITGKSLGLSEFHLYKSAKQRSQYLRTARQYTSAMFVRVRYVTQIVYMYVGI